MLNITGIKKELNKNIYVDNAKDNLKENYIIVTLSNKLKIYE